MDKFYYVQVSEGHFWRDLEVGLSTLEWARKLCKSYKREGFKSRIIDSRTGKIAK